MAIIYYCDKCNFEHICENNEIFGKNKCNCGGNIYFVKFNKEEWKANKEYIQTYGIYDYFHSIGISELPFRNGKMWRL